jgi:hypothetical protein
VGDQSESPVLFKYLIAVRIPWAAAVRISWASSIEGLERGDPVPHPSPVRTPVPTCKKYLSSTPNLLTYHPHPPPPTPLGPLSSTPTPLSPTPIPLYPTPLYPTPHHPFPVPLIAGLPLLESPGLLLLLESSSHQVFNSCQNLLGCHC